MSLSNSLVEQFVKVTTNKDESTKESTVYGTIVKSGNTDFVQLDGSELLTPVTSTISVKNGDRVTVMIKNHTAVVTGNISSPSPSGSDLDDVENNLGNQITELGTVIATKVSADELEVEKGRIDDLITDTVLIKEELVANSAIIDDLQADNVEINGTLTALNGKIQNLDATKIDASIVAAEYAKIEDLEATNLDVYNLNADYASFKSTTTESLTAINADISDLDAEKLDAEYANLHYANIDFTNIGDAAIENFFSKSGMIEDLVVSSGTITGQLVGVTISGDLIEGNTIKADKLVVLGSDGLYYKLNVNAETVSAEQTEYNSLNGSIITANTITAEKINVDDLVAFDATIGGFKITSDSIYSGVKESATNTTRGIFMNDDGEFSIGDSNNYLRFFKDIDGTYKLAISANSIKFGASSTPFIVDTVEEFYLSTSRTALSGGSWSESAPTVTTGHYIWRRNKVTYSDDSIVYTPSENGVCISGNDGQDGQPGSPGAPGTSITITSTAVTYAVSENGTTAPSSGWQDTIPSVGQGLYLWTRTIVSYSDGTSTTSYSVGRIGEDGSPGAPGTSVTVSSTSTEYNVHDNGTTVPTDSWTSSIPTVPAGQYLWTRVITTYSDGKTATAYSVARQGQDGSDGSPGTSVTITSTSVTYQASTSGTTVPTGSWSTSIPTVSAGQYLWTKTVVEYSDGNSTTSYSVGLMGQNGSDGSPGADGDDGRGIQSTDITYQAGSSQTTEPTGEWTSTVPSLTIETPYLWTRTVITYTDGTSSTSYSVSSTLESFGIGGTNLLLNSKFDKNINQWNYDLPVEVDDVNLFTNSAFDPLIENNLPSTLANQAESTKDQFVEETGGGWTIKVGGYLSFLAWINENNPDINGYGFTTSASYGSGLVLQDVSSKINETNLADYYTISIDLKKMSAYATNLGIMKLYTEGCTYEVVGESSIVDLSDLELDSFTRKFISFKIKSITDDIKIGLEFVPPVPSSYGICYRRLKLQTGNVENPEWTPAPEDDGDNLFLNSAFNGDSEFPIDISTLGTEDTPSDGVWYYSTGGSSSNLVQNDDCFSVECSFTTHNAGTFMLYQPLNDKITSDILPGYYTISGDFAVEGTPTSLMFYPNGIEYTSVSSSSETISVTSEFTRQRFACQITAIDSSSDDTGMGVAFGIYFAFVGTGTCKLKFKNLKISEGNVGHPIWSPAPEEIPDPTTIDIVTVDGITSAVINSESSSNYIDQNVVSRLITEDKNKIYSFGADVNLVGTDTTSLVAELYAEGKYTDSTSTLQDVVVTTLKGNPDITEVINDGWTRLEWIFSLNNVPNDANSEDYLNIGIKGAGFTTDNLYFKNLKFEKGNTPTDWSPAPGDVDSDIQDIQNATESVNDKVDSLGDRVTTSETSFQLLKDSISMLVTDANGESMMTQTSNGWTFNMSQIEENIDAAMNGLDELAGSVNEANQAIEGLDGLTKDLVEKTAYITMGQDDESNPYIELGRSDVEGEEFDFRVRITNTSMDFMQGTSRIAYVSNNMLYIEKSLIKNELQIGEGTGFVWKKRSNGNMGLRWVGG